MERKDREMRETDRRVTRIVFIGLGAMGRKALVECIAGPRFEVVAAVDPALKGQVINGQVVVESLAKVSPNEADTALLATGSKLSEVAGTIIELVERGMNVVSTCEELSYPFIHGEVANRIDAAALRAKKVVVGCGVNPGFVMDALAVMLSSAAMNVKSVNIVRSVNLRKRRQQLRDKVGVGTPIQQWSTEAFGHYGLRESVLLCATALGWPMASVDFERSPIQENGQVVGIKERAKLVSQGKEISLSLEFGLDSDDHDRIHIDGVPEILADFPRGNSGDVSTVARFISTANIAGSMVPRLRLPIEVPPGIRR
jgi:2,4-diaminopentanoate dehydrogenase